MILNRESIKEKLKPAIICTLFDSPIEDVSSFNHKQIQVMILPDRFKPQPSWSKKEVEYVCSFDKQANYDASKPTAIIPIRDCSKIITMCMESMKKTNTFELINVIIVDDRSTEDIKSIASNYGVSYLRVDYDSTFNFSMLCNLAAKVCNVLGNTQVIMWNADLYIADRVNLERLLQKHNETKSTLSGAKLLYPPLEYSTSDEEDTQNIMTHFSQMAGKWRGTIQFGGDVWHNHSGTSFPSHRNRFQPKNHPDANRDFQIVFMTGALQLLQLDKFLGVGGYNPSLERTLQDVDLCLNLRELGKDIYYFGKDIEFYHDESPSFTEHQNKGGDQMESDFLLYGLLNQHPSSFFTI